MADTTDPDRSTTSDGASAQEVLERFVASRGPLEPDRLELLLTQQCKAAAAVLAADAVGISMLLEGQLRIPLGASSDGATIAERVEFTLGQGPCLNAHTADAPVLVPDVADASSDAWATWPIYAAELLARTPFRAVFAFPLTAEGLSVGTMNLYRRQPGSLSDAETQEAQAVANRIFFDLLDTGMFSGESTPGLRWLNIPLARSRTVVWQAMGMATVELALNPTDALALMRAYCFSNDLLLDDLAIDIINGRLLLDELHP